MSKDINLVSFNGPQYDGQTIAIGVADGRGGIIADTVKCSTGLRGFTLHANLVYSGYEDALDVNNRCDGLTIVADTWVLDGCSMGFTIKGGSRNITAGGEVVGHGKETDVDLGNASDQSHDITTGVRLALKSKDGSPIRVRVLNADLPIEEPGTGPYVYVFPWKSKILRWIVVKVFMEFRRFVKRFK